MKTEPLKQLPTTKPGDQVLRRPRKPRGKLSAFRQRISRCLKGISGKL